MNELPDLNKRVLLLIEKYSSGNVADFARRIDIVHQLLNRCFNIDTRNGKYPKVTIDIVIKILEVFPELNTKWLLTGDDPMIADSEIINNKLNGVPFWNLPVSAGRTIESIVGGYKPDGYVKGLPGAEIAQNILPVSGVSMEPEISSGALIGVRLMNNWETLNTERIYLIITTEDRMIKRIEHDSENENILWCISPNYPRFKIFKSDIIEIQRVCFVYNPK